MKHFFQTGLLVGSQTVRGQLQPPTCKLQTANCELRTARSRSGSALVIVLGMLSVLLLMGIAFSVTMRTERSGASNMRHAAMARHILDSAVGRTMSDLDAILEGQGDRPVPDKLVVAVSSPTNRALSLGSGVWTPSAFSSGVEFVNPLSHEAALHLPGDQRAASLFSKAQWMPIYGDVRISTMGGNDTTSEDAPVGRFAYVALNTSGLLDPNIVAASNRTFGLSPHEISIAGEGNRALGVPSARAANLFTSTRNTQGHFSTMRDFLRPQIATLLGYSSFSISGQRYIFPTNCFCIGGFALDDLAPPTGKRDGIPIRRPKFPLREYIDPADTSSEETQAIDPADIIGDTTLRTRFLEAMTNSFQATYAQQASNRDGNLPSRFRDPFNPGTTFPYPYLAARNLLEMMDADTAPGGTTEHTFSTIGNQGGANEDKYLKAFGVSNWNWDRLPCVEPVPLIDNLVVFGGYHSGLDAGGGSDWTPTLTYKAEKETITNPDGTTSQGNVTNITFTLTLSLVVCPVYPGWNVPADTEGTYTCHWRIFYTNSAGAAPSFDDDNRDIMRGSNDAWKDFVTNLKGALSSAHEDISFSFDIDRDANGTPTAGNRPDMGFIQLTHPITFSVSVNPADNVANVDKDNIKDYVPDEFGFPLMAVGVMGRGDSSSSRSDVVQVVPAQETALGSSFDDTHLTSYLDLHLIIRRDDARRIPKDPSETILGELGLPVLGATYAADPRFAYQWGSWMHTPGRAELSDYSTEPYVELGKDMAQGVNTLDDVTGKVLGQMTNPLTRRYLEKPYETYGGDTLFQILCNFEGNFGGVSDEMRTTPDQGTLTGAVAEKAAKTYFFDPSEPDDSPWAFTRVGQLGCVPIGTFRTIALMDGFDNTDGNAHPEVRQRVLDYFTMHPPRHERNFRRIFSSTDAYRTALLSSRVNLNLPRAQVCTNVTANGNTTKKVVDGDYNVLPLAAVLNQCPLREWDASVRSSSSSSSSSQNRISWDTALDLASLFAVTLDRDDDEVRNANKVSGWRSGDYNDLDDAEGVTHSLSVLGRSTYDTRPADRESLDTILLQEYPNTCSLEREGVIRNSAEMLTTRQQLFTLLIKADSFTPKFGFSDANHGTSLASAQAIAHIWRDPEPLRDANGAYIEDGLGNPIHPWVLLDLYQF